MAAATVCGNAAALLDRVWLLRRRLSPAWRGGTLRAMGRQDRLGLGACSLPTVVECQRDPRAGTPSPSSSEAMAQGLAWPASRCGRGRRVRRGVDHVNAVGREPATVPNGECSIARKRSRCAPLRGMLQSRWAQDIAIFAQASLVTCTGSRTRLAAAPIAFSSGTVSSRNSSSFTILATRSSKSVHSSVT